MAGRWCRAFARQRLQALAHAESMAKDKRPAVLFLCVHNAGRSQMALGWFNHLAGDRAIAWPGGSEPVAGINPGVLAAMAEVGIDISREFSKPWTDEFVLAADVVITMGVPELHHLHGRGPARLCQHSRMDGSVITGGASMAAASGRTARAQSLCLCRRNAGRM